MDDQAEPQGSSSFKPIATIPAKKPAVGTILKLSSRTQVFINNKQGFQDVFNYTFEIAGMSILYL